SGPDDHDVLAELADELHSLRLELVDGRVALCEHRAQHLLCERLELVVLRHEIRLRAHAEDRAGRVRDHVPDEAVGGRALGLLPGRREAALTQEDARLFEIAARLLEGSLAVHHPGAGGVAQLLDQACGDRAHRSPPPSETAAGCGSASVWGSSAGASSSVVAASSSGSAVSSAGVTFAFPASTPSATPLVTRLQARMASSLPGITKSASSGSAFVSTSPITGMPSRRASRTASCSFFRSMTKTASGWRFMSATP